jgi:metal-responsive CopG/Arc/MetJ family transcriptional regulator
MKIRKTKQPNDYPRITLRIDSGLLSRIERLASSGGTSMSGIISSCIRTKLPELEKFHSKAMR